MHNIQELIKLFSECNIENVAKSAIIVESVVDSKINLINKKIAELDKELQAEVEGLVCFFSLKMSVIELLIKMKADLDHEKKSAAQQKQSTPLNTTIL